VARILQSIGLCRRAGKLFIGTETVLDAVRSGKAKIVILAGDTAEGTEKKITALCAHRGVPVRKIPEGREALSRAVGKTAPLAAVAAGEDFLQLITLSLEK